MFRIVCKTKASGVEKSGHVQVEVSGGFYGLSSQRFSYQVRPLQKDQGHRGTVWLDYDCRRDTHSMVHWVYYSSVFVTIYFFSLSFSPSFLLSLSPSLSLSLSGPSVDSGDSPAGSRSRGNVSDAVRSDPADGPCQRDQRAGGQRALHHVSHPPPFQTLFCVSSPGAAC